MRKKFTKKPAKTAFQLKQEKLKNELIKFAKQYENQPFYKELNLILNSNQTKEELFAARDFFIKKPELAFKLSQIKGIEKHQFFSNLIILIGLNFLQAMQPMASINSFNAAKRIIDSYYNTYKKKLK